jgi:hypothetical protein
VFFGGSNPGPSDPTSGARSIELQEQWTEDTLLNNKATSIYLKLWIVYCLVELEQSSRRLYGSFTVRVVTDSQLYSLSKITIANCNKVYYNINNFVIQSYKEVDMSVSINLKELERRVYRRTYEDGLLEIYLGGILVSFSIFAFNVFPGDTFEPIIALGLFLAVMAISVMVYWLGKKYITLPRIGMINFGQQRQQRKRELVMALAVIVGIQVVAILLQFTLLAYPELRLRISPFLGEHFGNSLVIAIVAALFVAPGFLLMAYYMEIPRGYFHAVITSLAIFFMIIFNQAWWMTAGGLLIMIEGIIHLIQFVRKYPLPFKDEAHAGQ